MNSLSPDGLQFTRGIRRLTWAQSGAVTDSGDDDRSCDTGTASPSRALTLVSLARAEGTATTELTIGGARFSWRAERAVPAGFARCWKMPCAQ